MLDAFAIARQTRLPAPPSGWFDHGYSVLMDGRLALIRTRLDVHAESQRWWELVKDGRSADGHRPARPDFFKDGIRLSVFDGVVETDAVVVPCGSFPTIDRMADGRWLVVSYRPEGGADARIHSARGAEERAFDIGVSFNTLFCAPDDTIWVGYSDQGIFAGPGKDGHQPPSTGGIVQFDAAGRVLWSFNEHARSIAGEQRLHVDDCYALTLTGNTPWACYYSLFPIVRLRDGTITSWSNDVCGAHAIAVADDFVLLAGGHDGDANRIVLVKVEGSAARALGAFRFDVDNEHQGSFVRGRDGVLHVVKDGVWYRISVADVAQAANAPDALEAIPEPPPPTRVQIWPPKEEEEDEPPQRSQ